jgi:SAM-dependent methyltransferase
VSSRAFRAGNLRNVQAVTETRANPTGPELPFDASKPAAAERCHACGSRTISEWLSGFVHSYREAGVDKTWNYSLVECQSCGLGFISPMPDLRLLQTFYQRDYHCYQENSQSDPRNEQRKHRIARFRFAGSLAPTTSLAALGKRGLAITAEWLSGKTISYSLGIPLQLPLDAAIFELGYGSGYWLKAMSFLGYTNLYGFDIDVSTVNRRELNSLGVTLTGGDFLTNDYPDDYFDCIRLEHVFEHLPAPRDVLQKLWAMLKINGHLVMTFPCKHSWSRKISSQHWGPLEPPVHLFHHTPESVQILFDQHSFTLKAVRPFSVTDQLFGTLDNVRTAKGKTTSSVLRRASRVIAPAYRAFGRMTKRGDFMTVWAQKAASHPQIHTAGKF